MWKRFAALLRCPMCHQAIELVAFEERSTPIEEEYRRRAEREGLWSEEFSRYVEAGVLLCTGCRVWFPIVQGVPVLLRHATALHHQVAAAWRTEARGIPAGYRVPDGEPIAGEEFVMRSFSMEWLPYQYDGVVWDLSYEDHERRFLQEVGAVPAVAKVFLEVGCGIGMTTFLAQRNLAVDAIGVDLSLSVLRAAQHFASNPFVHFVQASAFSLPFQTGSSDIVYSHGVLHHTYSTEEALRAIARYCRPGGVLYIWVYGRASGGGSPLRRLAYHVEQLVRPTIGKHLNSVVSRMFLAGVACCYLGVNALHRLGRSGVQPYSYRHGLHAARDRFTPLYAHRHEDREVVQWFGEQGLQRLRLSIGGRCLPLTRRTTAGTSECAGVASRVRPLHEQSASPRPFRGRFVA